RGAERLAGGERLLTPVTQSRRQRRILVPPPALPERHPDRLGADEATPLDRELVGIEEAPGGVEDAGEHERRLVQRLEPARGEARTHRRARLEPPLDLAVPAHRPPAPLRRPRSTARDPIMPRCAAGGAGHVRPFRSANPRTKAAWTACSRSSVTTLTSRTPRETGGSQRSSTMRSRSAGRRPSTYRIVCSWTASKYSSSRGPSTFTAPTSSRSWPYPVAAGGNGNPNRAAQPPSTHCCAVPATPAT